MYNITLIGDVHGWWDKYGEICKANPCTIQLGDMGMGVRHASFFPKIDPAQHKFIRGNHDSPEECRDSKYYLGDYGMFRDKIFFLSGAFSYISGGTYWPGEELSIPEMHKAVELYRQMRPSIVISHEAPTSAKNTLLGKDTQNSNTDMCLEQCLKLHRPKKWFFGHHHRSWSKEMDGVRFQCLDILECATLELDRNG